jgi:hypothetical protein
VAYRAEIEIAVKGTRDLTQFQGKLKATALEVEQLNKFLKAFSQDAEGIPRSIANLNRQLNEASNAFNDVALGTKEARTAAVDYLAATRNLNAGLRERANLLAEVAENERRVKLASAGIRERTQYSGPIGPGPVSSTALSSRLPPRSRFFGGTQYSGPIGPGPVSSTALSSRLPAFIGPLEATSAQKQAAITQGVKDMEAVYESLEKLQERRLNDLNKELQTHGATKAEIDQILQRAKGLNQYTKPLPIPGGVRTEQTLAAVAAKRTEALAIEQRIQRTSASTVTQYNLQLSLLQQMAAIGEQISSATEQELVNQRRINRELRVRRGREAQQRQRDALSSGIIGGAFPLLFGQGIGASVGGGVGGAAGGLIGGQFGFGLSLVGTALGTSFDALAKDAAELGAALDSVTGDANAVAKAAGLTGTDLGRLIEKLEQAGDKTQAMALATQELEEIVGKQGVKALRDFSATAEQMGRDLEALSTRIKALFAGIANVVFPPETTKRIEETKAIERARKSTDPRIQQAVKDYFDESNFEGLGLKEGVDARLAARQKILDLVKQEQDEMLRIRSLTEDVAQKEREKTAENETSLSIARARLIVEKNNGDILNATVEASLRAIAAEETRLKLIKAAGDARLIELALTEAATRKAEIDNQIKAAREALARKTARAESKAAESKALSLQRDILRERLNLFNVDEQIARVGLDRLSVLQREQDATMVRYLAETQILEAARKDALNRNKVKEDEALINELYDARLLKIRKAAILALSESKAAQDRLRAEQQIADLRAAAGFDPLALVDRTQPYGMYGAPEKLMDFSTGAELNAIVKQEVALARVLEKYKEIGQAAQLTSELVTTGFLDMVTGTKSVEEVFADFLRNLAEMLMKTAQQMIAQYIAIGIARAFGLGQSPAIGTRASDFNLTGFGNLESIGGNVFAGFADGGNPPVGRPSIVGERGPELFVPKSSGTIVPNHALGGGGVKVETINITVENTGESLSPKAQKQIAGQVQGIVLSTLANERRSGGML